MATAIATTDKPKRRMTINDVALEAGVSRTTVSFVLTNRAGVRVPDTTRQRILEAAEKIGYRRNALGRALQSGRMDSIGIIAPMKIMTSAPGTPGAVYYKDMVIAVSEAAFEAGLNPMFLKDTPSHKMSLAELSDRRVDGVVLFSKTDVQSFLQEAQNNQVPYVTIGSELGICQVHTDNALGGLLATQHLLELGHRRIGYLGFSGDSDARRSRPAGYQSALGNAGIAVDPSLMICADTLGPQLTRALRALLSRPGRPSALFCFNEELAVWLLEQCRQLKVRVPQDLSVVGFDNSVLSVTAFPRLTTIHSPLAELAQTAIQLLQAQIGGEVPPFKPTLVAPSLVVRDSTTPPLKT